MAVTEAALEAPDLRFHRSWAAAIDRAIGAVVEPAAAFLVLVEVVGLLHLAGDKRVRVVVAGCFAIGMGASLTPLGEPLSTLAARALEFNLEMRQFGPVADASMTSTPGSAAAPPNAT